MATATDLDIAGATASGLDECRSHFGQAAGMGVNLQSEQSLGVTFGFACQNPAIEDMGAKMVAAQTNTNDPNGQVVHEGVKSGIQCVPSPADSAEGVGHSLTQGGGIGELFGQCGNVVNEAVAELNNKLPAEVPAADNNNVAPVEPGILMATPVQRAYDADSAITSGPKPPMAA